MNAKRFLGVFLGAALAVVVSSSASADWVGDWFDQSTTTSPGSLKTQQRGYYTGGSFQARWRMTNDYPVSVSAPRFSAGCGGIDLFGGGFSFMDPEFLVQKFERAIQAAPAIAFQMAMDEYCKACTNAMTTMEQITNYLNSIQVNDCRMAKGIAAIPAKGDLSIFRDTQEKAMQGYAILSGQSKNGQAVDESVKSNAGKAPVNTQDMVADCPAVFKTVFTSGSVVSNVSGLLSLSSYSDVLRGLIGDVNVVFDTSMNNYSVTPVAACKGNDPTSGFDFITGRMEKRASGVNGTCSVASSISVQDQIANRMQTIANKLKATDSGGAALDATDIAFINSAPFSVLNLLRDAVKNNYVDEAINNSRDVLAPAYAAAMLDDFHRMARLILSTADEVQSRANSAASNPQKCDTAFLKPVFSQITAMDERAMQYRTLAVSNYTKAVSELNANLSYAKNLRDRRETGLVNETSNMR